MKTLLILFCLTVGRTCWSADSNLTWRLQIELTSANNGAANSLRGQVQSVIKQNDLLDREAKGSPIEVRENEPGGGHRVSAVYILKDEATATNALAQLGALKNPNIAGRVSLHCCPLEGTIKDWGGCDADARAKYREVKFP